MTLKELLDRLILGVLCNELGLPYPDNVDEIELTEQRENKIKEIMQRSWVKECIRDLAITEMLDQIDRAPTVTTMPRYTALMSIEGSVRFYFEAADDAAAWKLAKQMVDNWTFTPEKQDLEYWVEHIYNEKDKDIGVADDP